MSAPSTTVSDCIASLVRQASGAHGLMVEHVGRGPNANALVVVSRNHQDTALGVRSNTTGRAAVKITHDRPVEDGVQLGDKDAATLALRIEGEGTAAQGLFIDSTAGTTGRLANLRNRASTVFAVNADGSVDIPILEAPPAKPPPGLVRLYALDPPDGVPAPGCVWARWPNGAVTPLGAVAV